MAPYTRRKRDREQATEPISDPFFENRRAVRSSDSQKGLVRNEAWPTTVLVPDRRKMTVGKIFQGIVWWYKPHLAI